jgi:N-acetylglucosamine-6-phosphate deacetylase
MGTPENFMLALTAARLIAPAQEFHTLEFHNPLVLIEHDRIVEITSAANCPIPERFRHVDFPGAVLAPGFVDIHIHGGRGHDVMEDSASSLSAIETFLAQHGVTSYFPTTVTAPVDSTLRALDRLASAIEQAACGVVGSEGPRARPCGIHLEGPFLSHARRGVHPPEDLQTASASLFQRFWEAARGHIKIMTIAPELAGAEEVIAEATRCGICVSLGHSDADFATAERGIAAGARHATHTFNAMRALGHRDPGILGAVLTDERVTADIIADGIHLDPAIVRLFLTAKGLERSVLITDATAATGMPNGRYKLGPFEVEVMDGRCMIGDSLAGSVLTMDQAVRNVMAFAQWSLADAVRMATLNPAKTAGIEQQAGQLVPGAFADIVVLTSAGEVQQTIVRGQMPE